jgi:uncharacterized protein YfbU (UPF0304 family)
MPTITVRLDDETHNALQQRANERSATVSGFVRDLIREEVLSARLDEDRHQVYAPDTLNPKDRHMLSLLHRILARVLPEDANDVDGDLEYQLARAQVLEEGFTQEYWFEFAGITPELSKRDSQRVMDILDMYRRIDYSLAQFEKAGTSVDADLAQALRYIGFDHNDALEGRMADYVKHLIENNRWTERAEFVNGPTGGDSHSRVLETYTRMLAEYHRITVRRGTDSGRDGYLLSKDELKAIAAERIDQENRRSSSTQPPASRAKTLEM